MYPEENFWIREKTLIISNGEMEYVMKIVKSLDDSGLLIKGITQTIKMKQKRKDVDFSVFN